MRVIESNRDERLITIREAKPGNLYKIKFTSFSRFVFCFLDKGAEFPLRFIEMDGKQSWSYYGDSDDLRLTPLDAHIVITHDPSQR